MEPLRSDDPDRLGDYVLVGRLGQGSMGVVYLAQTRRGGPVAVKTLAASASRSGGWHARFRREVEASLRVDSPFTARVVDADLEHAPPYLVVEYIAGDTLADRVQANGPLSRADVVGLAAATISALDHMHRLGVVHRDLSPNNVILGVEGPRVVDLGVAGVEDATRLTATGTALGTPGFMSPEHARGETVGPASDVFSWASLVCYAASGASPFGSGRADSLLYRIVHEAPTVPDLPEQLQAAIPRCLEKRPEDRPTASTLAALITDHPDPGLPRTQRVTALLAETTLAAELGAQTTEVVTSKPAPSGWRGLRRHLVLGLAAAALLVAGAVTAMTVLPEQGRDGDEVAATERSSPTATDTPEASEQPSAETPSAASPEATERRTSSALPVGTETPVPTLPEPPSLYSAEAPHPLVEYVSEGWVGRIHEELGADVGTTITDSVCGSISEPLEFSDMAPSEFACVAYSDTTPVAVIFAGVSSALSEWGRWDEVSPSGGRPETEVLACWRSSAPWLVPVIEDQGGGLLTGDAEADGADIQAIGNASMDHRTAREAGLGPARSSRYAFSRLLRYCSGV